MNNQRKIELQRAITEIENPYPKNDLILSYADFLKFRYYLRHYQFNPIVFGNLLKLANNVWNPKKRINRHGLLIVIKQYCNTTHKEKSIDYCSSNRKMNVEISIDLKKQLFDLFIKLFDESKYISINQINEARRICNNVLINVAFTLEEEQWLCNNVAS